MTLFITLYIHFDLGRLLVLFFPGDQQLLKYLLEVPALQVYLEVPVVQIVLSPPLVLVFRNSQVVLVAQTDLAVLEDHVLLLNLPGLEDLEGQVLLELRGGPFKMNNIRRNMNRNDLLKKNDSQLGRVSFNFSTTYDFSRNAWKALFSWSA